MFCSFFNEVSEDSHLVVKYKKGYFLLEIQQIPTGMQCKIVTKNSMLKAIILVWIPLIAKPETRTRMQVISLGDNLRKQE